MHPSDPGPRDTHAEGQAARTVLAGLDGSYVVRGMPGSARVQQRRSSGLTRWDVAEDADRILHRRTDPAEVEAIVPLAGTLVVSGVALAPGQVLLSAPGRASHLRSAGPVRWTILGMAAQPAATFGRRGLPLPALAGDRLLRCTAPTAAAAALRTALSAPDAGSAEEVLDALAGCLGAAWQDPPGARERQRAVDALHDWVQSGSSAALPRISDRTLRLHCRSVVGMSTGRFARLLRLHLARTALAQAEDSVTEVAMRHGFTELGRFAGLYRAAFGETPSATLRRARVAA